ncbi:hypothetical protein AGLY_014169 [Aphis glycines]|uniref:BED-type domain-containing protein n=1 Tax=Aphis glycines TaxID=307491 RepID=A0A6G0T6E1_APHGL|nr:hypothetical protein AGLY_014169 [Aphis glycines]
MVHSVVYNKMPLYNGKTSEVWNHFLTTEDNKAKCGYCSIKLSFSGGNTANLKRHLLAKHSTVPLNRGSSSINQRQECRSIDDPEEIEQQNQLVPEPQTDVSQPGPSNATPPSSIPMNSQRPMTDFVQTRRPVTAPRMIVKKYYPFSIVEDPEFKKFVQMLNPGLFCPVETQLYEATKNDIVEQITKSSAVNNTSFMAVTAHFLNGNMERISYCLDCTEFSDRHTGLNIGDRIMTIIRAWDIDYKVTVVVSDNAANAVAGSSRIFQVICHQEQMGLPILKLKQDVVTRWNSTYDMLRRIIRVKDAVISTIAVLQQFLFTIKLQVDIPILTPMEWCIIEKSVDILKIFYEVTKEISGDKYLTLSTTIIFIGIMTKSMMRYENDTSLPLEISSLVSALKEEITTRLSPRQENELVTQSALLDLRFKKLAFSNTMCSISIPNAITNTDTSIAQEVSTHSQSLLWKSFDEEFDRHRTVYNPQAAGIIELDKYFNEPAIGRHGNPLAWWNGRQKLYPRIFILAKKRLCITASSVPCERLFSKASNIITDQRSRSKPDKVSKLEIKKI